MTSVRRSDRSSAPILVLLTLVFVFLLALTRISNYDIWYHLATGRFLLEAGFADTDPFTYTQPDAPMYLQSWLAGVIFYGIWKIGGVEALTVAKALLAVALFGLLWLTAGRARGHPASGLVIALALVVGAFGLKFRLLLRPHLLELLLLAGAILLLDRARWRILPLVPGLAALQLLWVNVHGSFPLGLVLPVMFLGADALDAARGRPTDLRRAARVAGLCVAALLAATAANPLGPAVLAVPFETLGRGEGLWTLGEYRPLRPVHLTGFFLRYTWGYGLLAALGLAGLAGAALRGRRPAAWEVVLFLVFLGLPPLVGLRFIAEFVVVASPLVARWWLALLPRPAERPRGWRLAEVTAGLMLPLLWWATVFRSPIYQVGVGEKLDKFPARAAAFLRETRSRGAIFNSLGFGGYLMWHLPGSRVFIDGRWTVYTEAFFQLYREAHTDPAAWARIEREFRPVVVILEYLTDMVGQERMPHLESDPGWALVFWDPVAAVYLKRVPDNAETIARYEYRWARPARLRLDHLEPVIRDPEATQAALRELHRAVDDNPRNAEALQGLAFLYSFGPQPSWDEGLRAATRALELRARLPMAHAAACRAYLGRGQRELARSACSQAHLLAPGDPLVARAVGALARPTPAGLQRAEELFHRGIASMRRGRLEQAIASFRESLELNPGNPAASTNLGFCLSDLGRHAKAVGVFEETLRRAPGQHDALFGLAMAQEGLGRREAAIRTWRRYLEEAPDSRWKQAASEHLESLTATGPSPDFLPGISRRPRPSGR